MGGATGGWEGERGYRRPQWEGLQEVGKVGGATGGWGKVGGATGAPPPPHSGRGYRRLRGGRYLPVVARVDQPGAVASWGVEVGVVGGAERAVEVPQPLSTRGDVTVDLVSQVLDGQRGSDIREEVASERQPPALRPHPSPGYLAVDAAVAAQAVGQAGVDAGVAGQAGELVPVAGLEGEGGVQAQLLV